MTTLLVISLVLAAQASATIPPRPKWLPRIWYAIGMCETHLDWNFSNSSYVSAFGIYRPAWTQFSTLIPERATPKQQLAVAQAIFRRYGLSAWGCYSHGGYRYWLSLPA